MTNDHSNDLQRAAAAKLIEFEQQVGAMSFDDVLARYKAHEWDVLKRIQDKDHYVVAHISRTEKGVRHLLALLEFYEFFVEDHAALTELGEPGGAS